MGLRRSLVFSASFYVLKGPEDVTNIDLWWRRVIAAAFGLALVSLALATKQAYKAAFGGTADPTVSPEPIDTVHQRLFQARVTAAADAKAKLSSAILRAFIGIFLAAVGLTATWFAPQVSSADKFTCILDSSGMELARFPGKTLEVTSIGNGVQVKDCSPS